MWDMAAASLHDMFPSLPVLVWEILLEMDRFS